MPLDTAWNQAGMCVVRIFDVNIEWAKIRKPAKFYAEVIVTPCISTGVIPNTTTGLTGIVKLMTLNYWNPYKMTSNRPIYCGQNSVTATPRIRPTILLQCFNVYSMCQQRVRIAYESWKFLNILASSSFIAYNKFPDHVIVSTQQHPFCRRLK